MIPPEREEKQGVYSLEGFPARFSLCAGKSGANCTTAQRQRWFPRLTASVILDGARVENVRQFNGLNAAATAARGEVP